MQLLSTRRPTGDCRFEWRGGAFGIPTFIPAEPRFYGIQLAARIGQ
ncbi:hypothetical protein [Porphyrobacter sp. GA68]|nr:hypothetical protein [Porphyrobacter sp. GA68]